MFKKRSSSSSTAAPILQKVSSFLKVQILVLSRKMRKPVISRIISQKKSRKNYGYYYNYYYYAKEYQFSPSSSPLIQNYTRKPVMNKKKIGYGLDLYSVTFLGKCLGTMKEKKEERRRSSNGFIMNCYPPKPPLMDEVKKVLPSSSSAEDFCGGGGELEDDDVDSIDERAEKFIERFYEEMRLQRRQDSFHS